MRRGSVLFSAGFGLAAGVLAAAFAAPSGRAFAQDRAAPAASGTPPAPASPATGAPPSAPAPAAPSQPPPGVPSDASAATLELTPRPVAYVHANAKWEDGFKTVLGELAKVKAAIKAAGLAPAGHPFALFLETDDKSFQFDAMVPLAGKPEAKELTDGVKIGDSPAGRAIKFLHRGAYDEIDSTYDLITAFLDEKGLESQNRFIEEYLTETTESDDANLEADIYVLLK
ncbi:MAG: GyrI-like domain-containing protein [Beijerinckiaceae bacterium]|nr:GyrI-like domain-containing protein [Beijerinckiaceae bacterium]